MPEIKNGEDFYLISFSLKEFNNMTDNNIAIAKYEERVAKLQRQPWICIHNKHGKQ